MSTSKQYGSVEPDLEKGHDDTEMASTTEKTHLNPSNSSSSSSQPSSSTKAVPTYWQSKDFYDPNWQNSFDLVLSIWMLVWVAVLSIMSYILAPDMFFNPSKYARFWLFQIAKFTFMLFVAFCGGLVIINYRHVKVNYTRFAAVALLASMLLLCFSFPSYSFLPFRKIQHFCAYLLPLAMSGHSPTAGVVESETMVVVLQWWGYWFTLGSFAILVYPVRTRIRFIDICFASLDRPEDRPYTLYWITTQVFLGYIILSFFEWYCDIAGLTTLKAWVFIPVMTTGIGDGTYWVFFLSFSVHCLFYLFVLFLFQVSLNLLVLLGANTSTSLVASALIVPTPAPSKVLLVSSLLASSPPLSSIHVSKIGYNSSLRSLSSLLL
jgi:hypothetical protein